MDTVSRATDTLYYDLRPAEQERIEDLLSSTISRYSHPESPEFLLDAPDVAAGLPAGLTRFLRSFRLNEPAGALVVRGFQVDDSAIGPTPPHWSKQADPGSTRREEFFFLLVASILGEPFGWSTLQDGRLVHNVIPIRGEEHQQSGHGSANLLEWHTEDGFHPYRCDYLGLMGLRNNGKVPTTYASVATLNLPEDVLRTLSEPRFLIRPDDEHLRHARQDVASPHSTVLQIGHAPRPTAILFGGPDRPYLRIDPYFMSAVPGDEQAAVALELATEQLNECLEDIVVNAGEILFIDNFRAVHGRRPFHASYDGADRWLKKSIVTRDLRRSRGIRAGADSRVLF
ncbi:arginine beta-hydroxylase, Fe(II)/alpha-ketoglutarate-dependent [Nonomuraea solani]|uniref:Arginine beta-hydroxylase, Fe(II)/alpha-ketoglutarate-dependent n=1 Tax=Nonomuraea solani TaxID=1144553 RepID=A0A1H6ED27_9ACTN|nr:guanitoxin biosynthesis L-enduracididine beta-hydroxylase GntD [Nonomuraea solani]SEG95662.1 arginine beta-hydroxylase, Fe(II)/alpha-ketoglutarate-dependent [Nonomuraea solani]